MLIDKDSLALYMFNELGFKLEHHSEYMTVLQSPTHRLEFVDEEKTFYSTFPDTRIPFGINNDKRKAINQLTKELGWE